MYPSKKANEHFALLQLFCICGILSSGWGTIKITKIRNRLSTEWKCGSGDYLFKWYSQTLDNNVSKKNVPTTARNVFFSSLGFPFTRNPEVPRPMCGARNPNCFALDHRLPSGDAEREG